MNNKNTFIAYALIFVILGGYFWYDSTQRQKQAIYQAYVDSLAQVENEIQRKADSAAIAALYPEDTLQLAQEAVQEASTPVFRDSLLNNSYASEGAVVTLQNDKLELQFNSKGAQPWAARVKDYRNYDGSDLYIFHPGDSKMGISVYAGEYVNTADFVFEIASQTDSSVVFRLPFARGGYIEQSYTLVKDSYLVKDNLSFVGMDKVIPMNVSMYDLEWNVTIPRMEKGYKSEVQYSKIDYNFDDETKPEALAKGRKGEKRIDNRLSWFAFHQQFFSAIMRSEDQFASGEFSADFLPEEDPGRKLMTCEAKMRADFRPGADFTAGYEFYFGPNHYQTLRSFGHKYEKTIPLGGWLVGWFTKGIIIPVFNLLHKSWNIANFGIIILIMTLFIKLVVAPFTFKSYSSTAKMQALKPEIEKINAKYPDQNDAMKKQQATMELYKRAGVNPMGGCLPMLFQMPILWAMFRFFPASIELRQQSFLWADDLSGYDSFINFGSRIPLLGDHISLFALLMAVSMFFYSKFTMSGQTASNDPNAASMKFMSLYMMPIMMFFICNSLSAGLSYYYLLSNIITMIETFFIKKFFVHPEQILAKVKTSEGKPLPKSKWQQRLEEAQRMQQQALREQQKKQRR